MWGARPEIRCEPCLVPPVALALIDAVFQLALHHDARVRRQPLNESTHASVHACVSGPITDDRAPGGIAVEIVIRLVPDGDESRATEERADFVMDLAENRLLAASVDLAELSLGRGGMARLIGELESWCYRKLPVRSKSGPLPATRPE